MNYEILLGFILATAALGISPGPDNIYVLTQSIVNGKKYGLATVAGLMTGCLIHTSLLAFGVSTVIKNNDTIFLMIKLFGVGYLLYLSYTVYKAGNEIHIENKSISKSSLWSLFKKGFIMNVLNPKVTIFFLAFFPGFLFSNSMGTVLQFYVLGFVFIAVSFLIFGTIAILAGTISDYILRTPKAGLFLKWLQIIVFIGIAVYLLLSDK
ncbi:LysE family translocator [Croceitalea sp. MTPC9]|uniref:LysE family translocator n=1 Tax=unclassified Croceitalea TaxID=2632280 RepID=UPI002B3E6E21|nr:LysE family translocator [Croceitalea sp. MTPC6]GMN15126.1 LysE family translocator [Croceitalea sp. MTPC9]